MIIARNVQNINIINSYKYISKFEVIIDFNSTLSMYKLQTNIIKIYIKQKKKTRELIK